MIEPEHLALKLAVKEYVQDSIVTIIPQLGRNVERIDLLEYCIESFEEFENGNVTLDDFILDYIFLRSGGIYAFRHSEFQKQFNAHGKTYLVTSCGYVLCVENSLRVLRENLKILKEFVGTEQERHAFFVIQPLNHDVDWSIDSQ